MGVQCLVRRAHADRPRGRALHVYDLLLPLRGGLSVGHKGEDLLDGPVDRHDHGALDHQAAFLRLLSCQGRARRVVRPAPAPPAQASNPTLLIPAPPAGPATASAAHRRPDVRKRHRSGPWVPSGRGPSHPVAAYLARSAISTRETRAATFPDRPEACPW